MYIKIKVWARYVAVCCAGIYQNTLNEIVTFELQYEPFAAK